MCGVGMRLFLLLFCVVWAQEKTAAVEEMHTGILFVDVEVRDVERNLHLFPFTFIFFFFFFFFFLLTLVL
jgi:hypothetical protein